MKLNIYILVMGLQKLIEKYKKEDDRCIKYEYVLRF